MDGISLDEYNIFINTEQLYKGYSTYIYGGEDDKKRKIDEIIDVIFVKEKDNDENFIYWGWYGISEKIQSLNQVNGSRGFRIRKANIQVGDEFSLLKLQRDKRFQFYFIGEIYALHNDLIPNARRDYFSENDKYLEFEKRLKSFFHTTIYRLCYAASEINGSLKRIEEYNNFQKEYQQKSNQGFTDRKEHLEYREKLEKKKEEALKADTRLQKIASASQNGATSPINKILDRITTGGTQEIVHLVELSNNESKPKFRTDNLSRLNKEERKFLGEIFRIIKNVLPNEIAENLIVKIEEEMK